MVSRDLDIWFVVFNSFCTCVNTVQDQQRMNKVGVHVSGCALFLRARLVCKLHWWIQFFFSSPFIYGLLHSLKRDIYSSNCWCVGDNCLFFIGLLCVIVCKQRWYMTFSVCYSLSGSLCSGISVTFTTLGRPDLQLSNSVSQSVGTWIFQLRCES